MKLPIYFLGNTTTKRLYVFSKSESSNIVILPIFESYGAIYSYKSAVKNKFSLDYTILMVNDLEEARLMLTAASMQHTQLYITIGKANLVSHDNILCYKVQEFLDSKLKSSVKQ